MKINFWSIQLLQASNRSTFKKRRDIIYAKTYGYIRGTYVAAEVSSTASKLNARTKQHLECWNQRKSTRRTSESSSTEKNFRKLCFLASQDNLYPYLIYLNTHSRNPLSLYFPFAILRCLYLNVEETTSKSARATKREQGEKREEEALQILLSSTRAALIHPLFYSYLGVIRHAAYIPSTFPPLLSPFFFRALLRARKWFACIGTTSRTKPSFSGRISLFQG